MGGHVPLFRELLERALEDAHARITARIEKRKRKLAEATEQDRGKENEAVDTNAQEASTVEKSATPAATPTTAAAAPWSAPGGANAWGAPIAPPGYGYAGFPLGHSQPPGFLGAAPSAAENESDRKRSRSRRRRHRSGSRKHRHRRREKSKDASKDEDEQETKDATAASGE